MLLNLSGDTNEIEIRTGHCRSGKRWRRAGSDTMSDKSTSTTAPSASTMNAAFDKLDTNHDGYLTKTEAQSGVADFAKADINKDGHLNQTEFASAASTTKKNSSDGSSS
jgi:Ca2+-binding EF-hand superfamily protein